MKKLFWAYLMDDGKHYSPSSASPNWRPAPHMRPRYLGPFTNGDERDAAVKEAFGR